MLKHIKREREKLAPKFFTRKIQIGAAQMAVWLSTGWGRT